MAKTVSRADIRWTTDAELSAVHAAHIVATGARCNDEKTLVLLTQPTSEINERLISASIDVAAFWNSLLSERFRDVGSGEACQSALLAAGCNEMQLDQTAKIIENRLRESRNAFVGRYPNLPEQLELRARPLRERWETYGAGILRDVERQIWRNSPPEDWWKARVNGVLLQPIRGGDGDCDGENGKFWIEAMLTDADPAIPEVIRLAWLVTRIAIENHTRERSSSIAMVRPWVYASVPLVLSAAQKVELIHQKALPIQQAMELWHFGDPQFADGLSRWWSGLEKSAEPEPLPLSLKKLSETLRAG